MIKNKNIWDWVFDIRELNDGQNNVTIDISPNVPEHMHKKHGQLIRVSKAMKYYIKFKLNLPEPEIVKMHFWCNSVFESIFCLWEGHISIRSEKDLTMFLLKYGSIINYINKKELINA